MINFASDEQLRAVAQSCIHFNSGGKIQSISSTQAENISCNICKNWDGERCVIDVFDNVLTSLDQT